MGLSSNGDFFLILPKYSRNVLERVSRSPRHILLQILTKRDQSKVRNIEPRAILLIGTKTRIREEMRRY